MFRITTKTVDDALVLKLEGSLTGPWVPELDACWRAAASAVGSPQVRVDLTAVCRVDDAGRRLMAEIYRAGSQFVTRGCLMPEIVREIAASSGAAPRAVRRN